MESKYQNLLIGMLAIVGLLCDAANEPNEHESIVFLYSRLSHNLIIKIQQPNNHWMCHIMTLNDTERHMVHTDDGIKAVELKYFAMLTIARKVPASKVSADDIKLCGHPRNGTVEYYSM